MLLFYPEPFSQESVKEAYTTTTARLKAGVKEAKWR